MQNRVRKRIAGLRSDLCVFITAGPSTKLFAWGEAGQIVK